MMNCHRFAVSLAISLLPSLALQARAIEPPPRTSLANQAVKYHVPKMHYAVLQRGDVTAVIVDNEAVDDEVLPGHRPGYSGVASLTHTKRGENLFVPAYAGLNFEHIHDGTERSRDVLFEPRRAAMQLRVVDEYTVELYQSPSPTWKLESCSRYALLPDGTIELTFECIPRAKTFQRNYIGLFWASYIHQPQSLDIHFLGYGAKESAFQTRWIRGITPAHGVRPTHVAFNDDRELQHDDNFSLSLVFNRSEYRYTEPWYFGVSGGMALAQMFRLGDAVRLTQSPSGGGRGNPAWDFQYLIPEYEIGKRYQLVMRAKYVPYESPDQMRKATMEHRHLLER